MKKNILIILSLFSPLLPAQTEQQSIELPDFVITGRQNITVPVAAKRKPDFIPTLSSDFFTPQFAPDELPLLISSEPVPVRPKIKPFDDYLNGSLRIQAGRYVLPEGELNLTKAFGNYLLSARAWGSNITEYIPNAGYNNSGISLNNDFFLSTKSDFLPGAIIKAGAEYSRDSYRLFASGTPAFKRETNTASAGASISSSYNRWINFGLDIRGNILSLLENGLKETNISSNGLFEFKQNNFTVGAKGTFIKQILDNSLSGSGGDNYYSASGYLKLFPSREINIALGINYSSNSSNSFFSPFGSVSFAVNKGLTISAEFNPHAKYYSVNDFIKGNIYFNTGITDNVFMKYKTDINALLRYEYEKQISVSLTAGYASIDNYFYYNDAVNPGKFDLNILQGVKSLTGGINLLFNTTGFGHFTGDIIYKDVKSQTDQPVPYEPKISASLGYRYDFIKGAGISLRYSSFYDIFTALLPANKLGNYSNLSVAVNYEILNGLKLTADFQNILNRTNFVWKNYQEKPFDLLLGIEYNW